MKIPLSSASLEPPHLPHVTLSHTKSHSHPQPFSLWAYIIFDFIIPFHPNDNVTDTTHAFTGT
jgi:hypothetical protein